MKSTYFYNATETNTKRSYTKIFGCFLIAGYSMQPFLLPGDLVITLPFRKTVKPGSIIAYRLDKEGITVIHRVVQVKSDYCLTKGDALIEADPYPVYYEQMIGKLLLIIPIKKALTALGDLFSDKKKLK